VHNNLFKLKIISTKVNGQFTKRGKMLTDIKEFSEQFLSVIENKKLHVISHFDTDGITSAAIMTKTLERIGKHFSTKIIKGLTTEEIENFPDDKLIIILDLGSGSLPLLSKLNNRIIIIDHHELPISTQQFSI